MRWLAAATLAFLVGCASSDPPTCDSGPPVATSSYPLGSGDQIRVIVFRQPDLSGSFAIDGQGRVALPLIGGIPAGGLTSRQLEDAIEQLLLAGGYLVEPQVSVQLLTYRPFYVLGEVGRPGSYEYRSGISVANAVALAGGYTYRADPSGVTIARGGCRLVTQVDSAVLPGDVVSVSERFF